MKFTLVSGRVVDKPGMAYCAAVKCNGRWSHKYYKTRKGALNELSWARNTSASFKDYYGIEDSKLIVGV